MVPKRKGVVLKMKDEVNNVNRLNKGGSGKKLAEEYGVGTSTTSDIKESAEWILKFVSILVSVDGGSTRKMMRRAEKDKAEDAVYKWFMQKCSQGQPISGLHLCEKALIFGEKLSGDP